MADPGDELRERARRAEHDERQLAFLRSEAARLRATLEERRKVLAAEERDVEKLEGFSLANLLLKVLGSKEACLELERREQVEARLRFEQTRDELERIEERIAVLAQDAADRLAALRARDEEHERRRTAIEARGDRTAHRLAELEARLEGAERRGLALESAAAACTRARMEFAGAVEALREAWSHGVADVFAVGFHANFAASEGKRDGLNQAQTQFTQGLAAVHRLEAELADTELRFEPDLRLPWGHSIADWWLDGLLTDWLTQRRLSEAQARAAQLVAALEALEPRLRVKSGELDGQLSRDRRLLRELLGG